MSNRDAAAAVISFLESYIDEYFPGSRHEVALFKGIDTFFGFGVAYRGGLTLIYANATSDGWWVQVQSSIEADIPDIPRALNWANDWNRKIAIGRYLCPVNHERGIAAIVFEQDLPGETIYNAMQAGPSPFRSSFYSWVGSCVRVCLETAADHAGDLGGRRLMPTESDLTALFLMAGAG